MQKTFFTPRLLTTLFLAQEQTFDTILLYFPCNKKY